MLLFLAAVTLPTSKLNTTALKSGEPLQISCFHEKYQTSYMEIQVNGTTVASSNNSFVHIIQSVRSTDAGSYTCLGPHGLVSRKEILSGKGTF